MSNLVFRWASIDTFRGEGIEDLLVRHWREIAVDQKDIPLAPIWDNYYAFEKAGIFRALGVWREDGLVGYNAFIVAPHLHYGTTLFANNDIIYADPEDRGRVGLGLIRKAEKDLFAAGVRKIVYRAKLHTGHFGDLLERLGYSLDEKVYGRVST